jgi:predicted kinase
LQLVLLMGIQATGKSTFCRERFFATHVRVNLDMLRTRRREELLVRACLDGKTPFVVDNTNLTLNDRARYITAAREAGFAIHGYYFASSAVESRATRNEQASPRAGRGDSRRPQAAGSAVAQRRL